MNKFNELYESIMGDFLKKLTSKKKKDLIPKKTESTYTGSISDNARSHIGFYRKRKSNFEPNTLKLNLNGFFKHELQAKIWKKGKNQNII